ncbi:MAG: Asp-tRNA(Asn)/Glu-tRNA(Gln) amidotransferase subunit GatC [Lachnospiraceae bacterium]|nr:Asp-tRNA(Asn)/Glu-tRNA(Gln) amidotransferase subunit GatC [Lachnospiraceae bacterium]
MGRSKIKFWKVRGKIKDEEDGRLKKEEKKAEEKIEDRKKNVISDETIEYVGILAKLELSLEEKEQAKKDMEEMLDYMDQLKELDTSKIEPMSHVFPISNVFREDVVIHQNDRENMLKNAPEVRDGSYLVPGAR